MIEQGNPRPAGTDRPASLSNAKAVRRLLRQAGFELRLDVDGQLAINPPDADVLESARPWLRRYRAQLVDLLKVEALLAEVTGSSGTPADNRPED